MPSGRTGLRLPTLKSLKLTKGTPSTGSLPITKSIEGVGRHVSKGAKQLHGIHHPKRLRKFFKKV